ncbi:MAG: hemolysin III family protein [Ferrimonas sp.]
MSVTHYSVKEELANAISHGVGTAAAIIGVVLMLVKGMPNLTPAEIAAISIYGASLILMFLSSTLYHSITAVKAKAILKRIDHCSIYLLIAGSYTPFMYIALNDKFGHGLLALIWALALVGVLFKAFFISRFKRFALGSYLLLGWASLIVIWQLYRVLPIQGFALLLIGGLFYSVGTIFYAIKSQPYFHAIWHLFVLAGAACHCIAIALFVIP